MSKIFPQKTLLLFLLALLVAACGTPATPTSSDVPTLVPTATAAPPLILLLAPPQADASLAAAAAEIASSYAAEQGLRFEQRQMLDVTQMPSDLHTLLIMYPDTGAIAMAAAAPTARVITIGFGLSEAPDLLALPLDAGDGGQAAFIAGYVAALTADDWRAGMIYTAASASWADDFQAGAEYFCGACNPVGPPFAELPQMVQASDEANWQTAADQLLANFVRVVYLPPELETSGAAQYLSASGVLIIGSGAPAADLTAAWLASVSADPVASLRQQLPQVLQGLPIESSSSLSVLYANPDFLSAARLAYVQIVIEDLAAGLILLPSEN